MSTQDTSPIHDIEKYLARWWVIVLTMILGGGLGWAVSLIHPAVYEARAILGVGIDSRKEFYLNASESNYMVSRIAGLISPRVLGPGIVEEYVQKDMEISVWDMQLERRDSTWDLVARARDPQVAADLANQWADAAILELGGYFKHAQRADELSAQLDYLSSCATDPLAEPCKWVSDMETLSGQVQSLQAERDAETSASKGVTTNMTFVVDMYAEVPQKPVANSPGVLMLAGALVGAIFGLLMLNLITGKTKNFPL